MTPKWQKTYQHSMFYSGNSRIVQTNGAHDCNGALAASLFMSLAKAIELINFIDQAFAGPYPPDMSTEQIESMRREADRDWRFVTDYASNIYRGLTGLEVDYKDLCKFLENKEKDKGD